MLKGRLQMTDIALLGLLTTETETKLFAMGRLLINWGTVKFGNTLEKSIIYLCCSVPFSFQLS